MSIKSLVDEILKRAAQSGRFIAAIAGPPGAGKSTLSEALAGAIAEAGGSAAVLPMDGFHMDNAVLVEKGLLARKGGARDLRRPILSRNARGRARR